MTASELHEALHDYKTKLEITFGMSLAGGGSIPGVRIISDRTPEGAKRSVKVKLVLYPPEDGPQTIGEVFRSLATIADMEPKTAKS